MSRAAGRGKGGAASRCARRGRPATRRRWAHLFSLTFLLMILDEGGLHHHDVQSGLRPASDSSSQGSEAPPSAGNLRNFCEGRLPPVGSYTVAQNLPCGHSSPPAHAASIARARGPGALSARPGCPSTAAGSSAPPLAAPEPKDPTPPPAWSPTSLPGPRRGGGAPATCLGPRPGCFGQGPARAAPLGRGARHHWRGQIPPPLWTSGIEAPRPESGRGGGCSLSGASARLVRRGSDVDRLPPPTLLAHTSSGKRDFSLFDVARTSAATPSLKDSTPPNLWESSAFCWVGWAQD